VASLGERLVTAINDVSGVHQGFRAAHARGVFCRGTFTATPDAAKLTRALHLQGGTVPVTVRFSNGSGDPGEKDSSKDGRGMSVKFHLPDGSRTDIVALTLPCFFVRTPDDFLEFMAARKPDPETGAPDMEKIGAFLGAHPEALPAVQAALSAPAPESYARLRYNSIHSFRWLDAGGGERFVRYRWDPDAGEAGLPDDAVESLAPDYLSGELAQRLAQGPATFRLRVVIAEPGDPVDDATAAWPEERETVEVGRLDATALEPEAEANEIVVFDPTNCCDGIEVSADPILPARTAAYTVSADRRAAVTAQA
jgi:catalase